MSFRRNCPRSGIRRCASVKLLNDMRRQLPHLSCSKIGRPRASSESGWVSFPETFSINVHQSGDALYVPCTPSVPDALSLLVIVMLSEPGESEMFRLLKMPLISFRSSET
jgi:hypothetical protein